MLAGEPSDGSDEHGLVWGYRFAPAAALPVRVNQAAAWLAEPDLEERGESRNRIARNLRQAAEEFASAVGDTLALAERVTILQEELAALVGEQTSRTLFVLTLVTVMALPINLVAALFGMNVGGVPLGNHPYGFAIVA